MSDGRSEMKRINREFMSKSTGIPEEILYADETKIISSFKGESTLPKPKEKALRYNQNKLRWQNVPLWLLEPVIEAGQFGEAKYGTYNFLKGLKINDCLDSAKRHISKFENPYQPDLDEESNINHLAHAAWNLIIALHFLKTKPELDDRYKGE